MNKMARVLLACALMLPAPALAQQTTGRIAGRVVDDQDAGIAGATVTATRADTGFIREVTSDENGLYRLPALPVGRYEVAAERQGLARFARGGIVVNIGRTTDLDIILRVAALTETITVTAEAPLVAVTSSAIGQIVDRARI